MRTYKNDKEWSDIFIPQLKVIATKHLVQIEIGNPIQDQKEGTDLIIFGGPQRIACRVRRPEFYPKYRFEFTIRARRSNGVKTEWAKLIEENENWRHVYIYAFSDIDETIPSYHVIDIPPFREYARSLELQEKGNRDGTTFFYAFDVREMPKKSIIYTTEIGKKNVSILDFFKDNSNIENPKKEAIEDKQMSLIPDEELSELAKKYHVKHGPLIWEDS
jgi:hypothetical protein